MEEHKHDWRPSILKGIYYCAVPYCEAELDAYFDDYDDSFAAHCEGYDG